MDFNTPIPTIKFPENKIPVGSPVEEPLVYLNNEFDCDSKYNVWEPGGGIALGGSSPLIAVRLKVYEMLKEAEANLPEGYHFKVYDAYRPIAVQQSLWDYYRNEKVKENPGLSDEEIDKMTAFCVSFPSYNILNPSLHNTGGAIDLTIVGPDGKELNMGCDFDDFTDKAWTNHFEPDCYDGDRDREIRDNRRMLYNAMISVGFTNLPSEWWHYDYGDDKWAQLNHTAPLYAGILDANIKESVPYPNMDKVRELDQKQQALVHELINTRDRCAEYSKELVDIVKKPKEINKYKEEER